MLIEVVVLGYVRHHGELNSFTRMQPIPQIRREQDEKDQIHSWVSLAKFYEVLTSSCLINHILLCLFNFKELNVEVEVTF